MQKTPTKNSIIKLSSTLSVIMCENPLGGDAPLPTSMSTKELVLPRIVRFELSRLCCNFIAFFCPFTYAGYNRKFFLQRLRSLTAESSSAPPRIPIPSFLSLFGAPILNYSTSSIFDIWIRPSLTICSPWSIFAPPSHGSTTTI